MTFISTADVGTLECIGVWGVANVSNHGPCPAPAIGYTNDDGLLEGPVPAGGGVVTDLQAFVNSAPGAGGSHVVEVMNNTTDEVLTSCTMTGAETSCTSSGTDQVAPGRYLQVRITNRGAATNHRFRVSFRY